MSRYAVYHQFTHLLTTFYGYFIFFQDEDQESIIMPNKHGEKFLCFLPKVEKSKSGKPVAQQNLSSMIMESETHMKLKTPDELLEVLKDRCFIRVKFSPLKQRTNMDNQMNLIKVQFFFLLKKMSRILLLLRFQNFIDSEKYWNFIILVSVHFAAFFL